MKTQHLNPAYQKFSYLLPADGLYPARYVDIFWNRNDDSKIMDVEAVFIPRSSPKLPSPHDAPTFWNSYADYNSKWTSDLGNSCDDWLKDNELTPESIFGSMLKTGFVNKGHLEQALEEFAHIKECDWARKMLAGFGAP